MTSVTYVAMFKTFCNTIKLRWSLIERNALFDYSMLKQRRKAWSVLDIQLSLTLSPPFLHTVFRKWMVRRPEGKASMSICCYM